MQVRVLVPYKAASQGGRPSPETPRGSKSDLRVPTLVNDVDSSAVEGRSRYVTLPW